jgi:hypothetical protein
MAAAEPAAASYDDELRRREALREAFGDSSESDSDAPREAASSPLVGRAGRERWRWEAVPGVRGLWLCADFLPSDDQLRLLAAIQRGEPRPVASLLPLAISYLLILPEPSNHRRNLGLACYFALMNSKY